MNEFKDFMESLIVANSICPEDLFHVYKSDHINKYSISYAFIDGNDLTELCEFDIDVRKKIVSVCLNYEETFKFSTKYKKNKKNTPRFLEYLNIKYKGTLSIDIIIDSQSIDKLSIRGSLNSIKDLLVNFRDIYKEFINKRKP